jgi:hypothetical protein
MHPQRFFQTNIDVLKSCLSVIKTWPHITFAEKNSSARPAEEETIYSELRRPMPFTEKKKTICSSPC